MTDLKRHQGQGQNFFILIRHWLKVCLYGPQQSFGQQSLLIKNKDEIDILKDAH